jgi:rhodanese-related sulfurtransferase
MRSAGVMRSLFVRTALAAALVLAVSTSRATSPEQLEALLAGSTRVVVVDLRTKTEFAGGHVPGSLNIPLGGLEQRRLPPFGRVVAIWDGVDREAAERALAVLNSAAGIQAELLDGGYPAWAVHRATGSTGLSAGGPQTLTYADLLKLAAGDELTVIDLRAGTEETPLTEIRDIAPRARFVEPSPLERAAMRAENGESAARRESVPDWLKGHALGEAGVYVVVDDGDAVRSEVVARLLRARGISRAFVLAGGELALRSRGRATEVTQKGGGDDGD